MEKLDWEMEWTEHHHWSIISICSFTNSLLNLLSEIPRHKWNTCKNHFSAFPTLLHYACVGKNDTAILLLLQVIDVNHRGYSQTEICYPIQTAIRNNQSRNVEIMLAAGFDRPVNHPLGLLSYCVGFDNCAEILVSNGYRLKHGQFNAPFLKDLIQLEKSVIQCRDIIVVLLGLKKRKRILGKLDRFLIQQELAVAIWSTRCKWNEIR